MVDWDNLQLSDPMRDAGSIALVVRFAKTAAKFFPGLWFSIRRKSSR